MRESGAEIRHLKATVRLKTTVVGAAGLKVTVGHCSNGSGCHMGRQLLETIGNGRGRRSLSGPSRRRRSQVEIDQ